MAAKKLIILQHNVRHWENNKVNLYNAYRHIDPDIILINSHGSLNNKRIKLFGYVTYQRNNSGELNDGVALAIKSNIKHRLVDDFIDEFIGVKIQTTLGDVLICTTYLPPRRNYLPAQDLLKILNNTIPTYILGDFNGRHAIFGNADSNNVGRALNTLIQSGKLIHLGPHFPTFIAHGRMTQPDKVFSNNKAFFNYHIKQGPLTTSDHIPLIFTIATSPIQVPVTPRLQMKKADWSGYRQELNTYEVPNLDKKTLEEIDDEVIKLQTAIQDAINKYIPKIHYRILPHNKMTDTLRLLQTQYNNILHFINKYNPTVQLMSDIRNIQMQLQDECLQIHFNSWNDLISKVDTNNSPQEFWKNVNKMMGHHKEMKTYIVDQNGIKLYEDYDKEEAFRRQWEKVFSITEEENENFNAEHEEFVTNYLSDHIERVVPFHTSDKQRLEEVGCITEGELLHYLRHTKEKTPGFSGITRNMIYNLPRPCILTMLEIFNAALSAGYFIDQYKIAKMIFIPKQDKNSIYIMNNRPISLLDTIGKLYEKSINKRLKVHTVAREQINPRQHGFTDGRGTQTALALITEMIANKKAAGCQVNIVLRDVKKAFDKVWHHGLKYKILQLNLPSPLERVLCDYLDDRKARIYIGKHTGPEFPLLSGVPQGSVLAPTLYNVYTADMPPPAPYSEHIIFADDITQIIAYPGKSTGIMANHTARAIENINKFEQDWKIQTNMTKFKIIPITKRKNDPVIVEGNLLPYATEGTVLGLKITTTGYRAFYKEKINRAKINMTKIRRFCKLSTKNKLKLYNAFVKSALLYPPIPMNAAKKTNMRKMQIIQNKSLRQVYNIKYPDVIRNDRLHATARVKTINEVLHEQARKIWTKVDDMIGEDMISWISEGNQRREHYWLPRSRLKALGPSPQPIY